MFMSPIYSFFLKKYADLVDAGIHRPTTTWNDKNCGIIYITEGDLPTGYLVYDISNNSARDPVYTVISAYVEPMFDTVDLMKQMITEVEDYARKQGCLSINISVSNNNTKLIDILREIGYDNEAFFMYKKV
jgi:hypothetical protein